MQIYSNQLTEQLNKNEISPVYIFASNEVFWLNDSVDQLLNIAFQKGFDKTNIVRFSIDNINLAEFEEACVSTGIFSSTVIVILTLKDTPNKFKDNSIKALNIVNSCLNPTLLPIICMPRGSKNEVAKCKPLTELEKKGIYVPFYDIDERSLLNFINQRAKSFGFFLNADSINLLAQSYEGNITGVYQALKKMDLCGFKGNITFEQVKEQISTSNHFSIFEINDAFINPNVSIDKRITIIETLLEEGCSAIDIIKQVGNALTSLYEMRSIIQNNGRLDEFFNANPILKAMKSKQAIYQAAANKYPIHLILECINLLSKADIRARSYDDKEAILLVKEIAVKLANPKALSMNY